MSWLESIGDSSDVRELPKEVLPDLAAEVRAFLVRHVCETGGHLGPNLGVVELTIALHRVFHSPDVPIIFDTGHQTYVHKILTGRAEGFDRLRQDGGLSGYPHREESPHDHVENSHASTALAYADGMSKAFDVTGNGARPVVAVIGDGAMTGGLAWEALNNLGGGERRVVVVLNDNGRSYSPTVGGLHRHLDRLNDRVGYQDVVDRLGKVARRPSGGDEAKGEVGGLFTDMGLDYLGPVDGHDIEALETALRSAAERSRSGPVVLHCRTVKGKGYAPAAEDLADHLHTVGVVDPSTGRPTTTKPGTWTDAFAEALVDLGHSRDDLVAVGAAMLGPTGLQRFADAHPQRCFDVGIAEQEALTSAAGMAMGGVHPVVALYATFAGRGFDQLLMDIGLHGLPVTLVLDRAGVTGPDGASHHGQWDLAVLGAIPGLRIAAPRDAQTLVAELEEAVDSPGPTVLRFPKAAVADPIPAVRRTADLDILRTSREPTVLIVAAGAMVENAVSAATVLESQGIECTVVDPRWVSPPPPSMPELAATYQMVITVEDGIRSGGFGSRLALQLADAGVDTPVRCLGLPTEFVPQASRTTILSRHGLDATGIAESVRFHLARATSGRAPLQLLDAWSAS